ncbi:hypothetical protein ACQY0O_003592 [Thecaphora frezii]
MTPALDTSTTLSVPHLHAPVPVGKSIRRQPSASRITVATRTAADAANRPASRTEPTGPTVEPTVAAPVVTFPAAVTEVQHKPQKPRLRRPAARRRARGRGAPAESESEIGSESEDDSHTAGSAASSSSVSQASLSDSEDSDEESDDDDGGGGSDAGEEPAHDDEREPRGAAAVHAADAEPGSLASMPEALDHQQWSMMAEEEGLSTHARTSQPAPAPSTASMPAGEARSAGRGGRGGRGRGRGGPGAQGAAASHVGAALAYRERLQKDPSFTPRVGQFWGHDERLLDQDLRGLSGWWRGRSGGGGGGGRGRGGSASFGAANDFAPRGGFGRGRGRGKGGAARGGSAAPAAFTTGRFQGGSAGYGGASQPRKSKLAGWDDDESEVDDDALHGKSVRRVPAAAQPIAQQRQHYHARHPQHPRQAVPSPPGEPQGSTGAVLADRTNGDVHPEATAAIAASGEEAVPAVAGITSDSKAHSEWTSGQAMGDSKIGAWKATLDKAQVSPSLPPQKPDSAVELSSSTAPGSESVSAPHEDDGDAEAKTADSGPIASRNDPPAPNLAATVLPSSGFGRSPGAGDGQWTHDGFEALQRVESQPTAFAQRGGPREGGMRGGAAPRGFGRHHCGGFAAVRGRGGFVPSAVRGRGGAAFARGGARGGAGLAAAHRPSAAAAAAPTHASGTNQAPANPTTASVPAHAAQTDEERLNALVKGLAVAEQTAKSAPTEAAAAAAPTTTTVKVNLPRTRSRGEALSEATRTDAAQAPSHAALAHPSGEDPAAASSRTDAVEQHPQHPQSQTDPARQASDRPTTSLTAAAAAVPSFQPKASRGATSATKRGSGSVSIPASAAMVPAFRPGSAASGRVSTPASNEAAFDVDVDAPSQEHHGGYHYPEHAAAAPVEMAGYAYGPGSFEAGGAVYFNNFGYGPPPGYALEAGPMQPMYSPTYGPSFGMVQGDGHPVHPSNGPAGGDDHGHPVDGYGSMYAAPPPLPPVGAYYQAIAIQPSESGDHIAAPGYDFAPTPPYGAYAMSSGDYYPGYYNTPQAVPSQGAHHYSQQHPMPPLGPGAYPMESTGSGDSNVYTGPPSHAEERQHHYAA